jgi:hypothetical protein
MKQPKTWLGSPDRRARLNRIQNLDPQRDCREITKLFYEDFGTLMLLQSYSGNLMSFAAPSISRILGSTGEFEHRVAKRFLDTALLAHSVICYGLESAGDGRDAARRVNSMHRRYDIDADDFMIIGIDNILMAIEFAERFGWRPVTDIEREAIRHFYGQVTQAFGGRKPLPPSMAEVRAFWEHYMNNKLAFEPQALRMTDVLTGFIKTLFPPPLSYCLAPLLLAQVDPRILKACGKPVPGAFAKTISDKFFRMLGKNDPAPDGAPDGLAALAKKVYPNGYTIKTLGTHLNQPDEPAAGFQAANR